MGKIRDYLWEKAGREGIPMTGSFELTPMCNLSCKMCYVRKNGEEAAEAGGLLNGDKWLSIAKEASDEGLLFPLLTGGEPLLYPEFKKVFTGMQELGLQISINTNATLIDDMWVEWFKEHTPTRLNITLYGAGEDSYKALCGNGDAFNRMERAVILLKKAGIPVKFNTSIVPENVHELDRIISFAKKMESPIQVATYMFPPIRREKQSFGCCHRLSPEDAGLAKVRADYLQGDKAWFLGQAHRYDSFVEVDKAIDTLIREDKLKLDCRAGSCSFWIDWQGNISNCGMYNSITVPKDEKSFSEAWSELKAKTKALSYAPACLNCSNQKICHTCIAMVYTECGNIDGKPEYLCRMNQAAAKYYKEYMKKI